MKTPQFWYQHRSVLAVVLAPFSSFYYIGNALRRALVTPYRSKVTVICIGNIVAGGSGKTPTALTIARILQAAGHKPVFVTRGYGGKVSGPLRVDPLTHSAFDVGDEALLLAETAPVWIGRDRAAAIKEAEKVGSHIILDDGLQNPSIRPDLSLLVIDGEVGLGNGLLIPAGPLREGYEGVMKRITAVLIIGAKDVQRLSQRVRCPLLRGRYEPVVPSDFSTTGKFFAFSGIARPEKFYTTCKEMGLDVVGTRDFEDHHFFSARELDELKTSASNAGAHLITTEKDYVRLPEDFQKIVRTLPITLVLDDAQALTRLLKIA